MRKVLRWLVRPFVFAKPLALTAGERVLIKGAWLLLLFLLGLQLGIARGRWLAGYEARAGGAMQLTQEGGPTSGATVTASPVQSLPAAVAEALTADCHPVSVAAALQTAQAFRDSAAGADASGPVSLRAVYAQAAVAEEMRALRCLWWWDR